MPQRRHAPELKLLHGVDKHELVDPRPKPARREPKVPTHLSVAERKLWTEVTAELRDMDMLSSADVNEIEAYVVTVGLCQRIHADLRDSDTLINRNLDTGLLHANPMLVAYDRAVNRAHQLASGLGLNPHGRSLIHGRTVAKPDTEAAHVKDLYA